MASDDVWAVSTGGLARFDGRTWVWASGEPRYGRVWALGKDDVWTAEGGGHGTVNYGHWDGSTWQRWRNVVERPAGVYRRSRAI